MNFLQLVQRLHSEVGAAGNAPASVLNQRGENLRLVNWILQSDLLIQNLWTRWKFLRATFSGVTVVPNNPAVPAPSDLKQWDFSSFFVDGSSIEVVEYNKVRSEFYDLTSFGPPSRIIVMPNKSLKVEPVPDAVYTITADYYRRPSTLVMTANASQSVIPEDFHPVILGRAQMLYGNYEDAPEQKLQGGEIYGEFIARLQDDQLPNEDNAAYKGTGGFFEVIAE